MRPFIFKGSKRARKIKNALAFIIVLLLLLFSFYKQLTQKAKIVDKAPESEVFHTAHFLDALQGDCTLIESADGKFALIDTSTNLAEGDILEFLKARNVQEIEYLILTPPHEDHIGCSSAILENFKVNNVYMTDRTETTSAYDNLLSQLKISKDIHGTKVIRPRCGDVFRLSDIVFTVISDGEGYESLNNSSICLKVECGKSTFLFTGDAEWEVENDLIYSGISLDAEVFKCAHHGSSTSNSEQFMDRVNPDICIISCGKDNDYGHPHREVISYLKDRSIPYYITHEAGSISIAFSKKSIVSPTFDKSHNAE